MKAICIGIGLLVFIQLSVPCAAKPGGAIPYRHFGSQSPLPSTIVYATFQDRAGYIWFCTDHGLSRFDGSNFHNLSEAQGLRSNYVLEMGYLGEDSLLVLTYDGGLHLLQSDRVTPLQTRGTEEVLYLQRFAPDPRGGAWLINQQKIFFYRGGKAQILSHPYPPGTVLRQHVLDSAALWISGDAGLLQIDRTSRSVREHPAFKGQALEALAPHGDSILIGGEGILYALHKGRIRKWEPPEWQGGKVAKVLPGFNGGLLVYVKKKGLFLLKNGQLEDLGKHLDLGNCEVNQLYRDRAGNVWISTYGKGVYCLPNVDIRNYDHRLGLRTNLISALYCEGDSTWVGYPGGMAVIREGQIREHFREPFQENWVDLIQRGPEQQLLFISGWILYHLEGGRAKFLKTLRMGVPTPSGYVYILGQELRWGLLSRGLTNSQLLARLPANKVYSLHLSPDSSIWIASNRGLIRYRSGHLQSYTTSEGLPSNRVYSIAEDPAGSIIVGTSRGIALLQNGRCYTLSKEQGLAGSNCPQVLYDPQGRIWVGCNGGLSLIEGSTIRNFRVSAGLISEEVRKLDLAPDGSLWVGTSSGISVLRADSTLQRARKPRIFWTGIHQGQQQLPLGQRGQLPYKNNQLQLDFQGIDTVFYDHVEYRYRFSGNPGQEFTRTEPHLNFSGLGPGDYEVEIRAVSSFGLISDALRYSFSVEVPWWQRSYVWIPGWIGLALLAAWLGRLRLKRRTRQQQKQLLLDLEMASLRQQALNAAMAPHFVSNALINAQQLLLEGRIEEAKAYFEGFSRFMRLTLQNGLQDSISLQEELDRLEIYLTIQSLRYPGLFDYRIEVEQSLELHEIEVPSMILQIFVENAILHGILPEGQKGHISIKILSNGSEVYLLVEDDGVGISPDRISNSEHPSAIGITRERLRILSSFTDLPHSLEIQNLHSLGGKGTRVRIVLPLE